MSGIPVNPHAWTGTSGTHEQQQEIQRLWLAARNQRSSHLAGDPPTPGMTLQIQAAQRRAERDYWIRDSERARELDMQGQIGMPE